MNYLNKNVATIDNVSSSPTFLVRYNTQGLFDGIFGIVGIDILFISYFLFKVGTPLYDMVSTVQCTVYNVQCTMYSVQCTVYNVQCTMYSAQCTMYSVQCTVYNVQCIMYSVQCTVYNVQCTLYMICNMLKVLNTNNSQHNLKMKI